MKEIELKISYTGGYADEGLLDIYDASESIRGLARALAITTHAFANDGEIRRRAVSAHNAKIFLHPPRQGSFEALATVALANPVATFIGTSVVTKCFWDFLQWTWSNSIGRAHQPETRYVRNFDDRVEPFVDEMGISLESAMEELHRPIKGAPNTEITIYRPRVGEVIKLDQNTLSYVTAQVVVENQFVTGNVTKYNILSGFGKFYDDELGHTISFDLDADVSNEERALLSRSLDERNRGLDGKIVMTVQKVYTGREVIKRYKVFGVQVRL
ncbi:hypothetical protein VCA79_005098 [Pseudomonas aeruginosa]|nr:hypothetical protein [Pseudomonas aeruginosa]EMC2537168.1 hypothetical protein [Pseudomonas aeruginosa]